MNKKVFLDLDGDRIEIENALIGGKMAQGAQEPFSVYAGPLDIGDIGLALLHIMRATIKITMDELHLPLQSSEEFMLFTLKTALQLERAKRSDLTTTRGMEAFIKKYKGNQY
jgi:hypothetical protein